MDHEFRSSPPPPLLTGLEKVLALAHSSPGDVVMAKDDNWEEYLSEEEMDEAAAARPPSHHHGDVLPSTWDLSDSWGTTDDEGSAFVQGMGSSSTSGHYKWRPEACGSYHAALSSDRRTVRYVGKANHPQDVGTVKSDHPLPRDRACFYFEVEVLSTCENRPTAAMTVGLAAKGFPMHRQPGTWPHSYGYRGSDGCFFAALPPECTGSGGGGGGGTSNGSSSSSSGNTSTREKDYGPAFGKGDVIGCGVDFATQKLFYTKNGKYLGVAFQAIFRRPGHQQQQRQCHSGTRQGVVRRYIRPYLSNSFPTAMIPGQASSNTAAAVPVPSSPPSSSSGIAPTHAFSILSRSRFLPESAAAHGGGRDGGDSPEEGRGAGSTNTTTSRGLAAAVLSGVAASRASWLADAGEEEGEQDEDEDMEEEEEEGAGRRESGEQGRRRSAGAGQEGGGGGGGGGRNGRERRGASISEGSSSSSTASAANRTDMTILYDTGRPVRQRQQQQHQQRTGGAASSPPALAVASSPEVAWELFPVLSLHGVGVSARVNFGQEPFCFDLQAKRAADEAERERRLAGEGMERVVEEEEVDALIKDYLLVAGYRDTLRCFDAVTSTSASVTTTPAAAIAVKQEKMLSEGGSSGSAMDVVGASEEQQPGSSSSCGRKYEENASGELNGDQPSTLAQSLHDRMVRLSGSLTSRHELRQTLLSGGEVAVVTEHLIKRYPRVWSHCPALRFELHSLAYLDLLRQGEGALREALVYAQQKLLPFALVDTHTVEAKEGPEGEADQDSSMNMVVCERESNDDGHPSRGNDRKMHLRRRRSHRMREVDPGGPVEQQSLAPGPLRSSSFVSPALDFAVRLRDLMGLLAYYPNLSGSPAAYLLSQNHREDVAEKLNAAILEEEREGGEEEKVCDRDDRGRPLLERALVDLASMHETLREVKSGGRGESFRLPALSQTN